MHLVIYLLNGNNNFNNSISVCFLFSTLKIRKVQKENKLTLKKSDTWFIQQVTTTYQNIIQY